MIRQILNFMNNKLNEVVIVSAIRTPIGAHKGSLKNIRSDQLGSVVIKEVLKQSKFSGDEIDDVIMGQVLTAGAGQNPARQAAINAGIPISKPAHLINQVCGSGLRAVISGYQSIKLGESLNIISGGQENMSIAPHSIFYREEKKITDDQLLDTMVNDGLIDAFNNYHMGVTAENVAEKFNISRQEDLSYLDNLVADARLQVLNALEPILEEITNEKGLNVIFDKSVVLLNNEKMDITKEVLKTLNKDLPSINISKE